MNKETLERANRVIAEIASRIDDLSVAKRDGNWPNGLFSASLGMELQVAINLYGNSLGLIIRTSYGSHQDYLEHGKKKRLDIDGIVRYIETVYLPKRILKKATIRKAKGDDGTLDNEG